MRVPIQGAFDSTTLDASGNGTAKVGPISAREIWYPSNAHVSANIGTVTNEAQCIVYVGNTVGAGQFRDGTLSGSSGDATGKISADIIKQNEYVFAVWSGGDPGATATLVVTGYKDV